jgi:hypothetical protein
LWFDVLALKTDVRWLGKTRGAIGFALIFLCFVSLYQDKEIKKKVKCSIGAICSCREPQ